MRAQDLSAEAEIVQALESMRFSLMDCYGNVLDLHVPGKRHMSARAGNHPRVYTWFSILHKTRIQTRAIRICVYERVNFWESTRFNSTHMHIFCM